MEKRYRSVREVTDQERIGMVRDIFTTVTGRYDFLNHFLSLRRDIAWRRFAVKKMLFGRTNRFLDVASGTADLAIDAAVKYPAISVIGLDFVKEMLDLGQDKLVRKRLSERIRLVHGDALCLPFDDNTFDVSAIAFGIRNIPAKTQALGEMLRVVVPGGQVLVLEMSFTRNWFSNLMYHTYLNRLLPRIAKRFSLNPSAYYYLADSIMNFPSPDEFLRLMQAVGMVDVKKYKLTLGTCYLYAGTKKQ
ncbi:MAG: Demethylmenaquinone methyltransferase [Syntrophorhabdaceae bacterium PtaU1.Bin034]|nr:MAG: Demethylmenaquinone methyltransferase [Syntrophorhabdaceae bacterium PtaU1.Bin034]